MSKKKKKKKTEPRPVFRRPPCKNKEQNEQKSSNPMVTTNAPMIICQDCQTNYTSVLIGEMAHCLKYGYKAPLSSAVSSCAKDDARPPLPTNAKEN